jgi:hypothetical protein
MPDTPSQAPEPVSTTDPNLADRLERLEAALAAMNTKLAVPPPSDELTVDRLMKSLAERAAQLRAGNGLMPAGLLPAVRMIGSIAGAAPGSVVEPPDQPTLRQWLVTSVFGELKLFVQMYIDSRYRLSRLAQFGVPTIGVLVAVNYLFFNYSCFVPILNLIAERVVLLLLGFALFKILSREAVRYRQVLNYLSQYGYP